MLLCGNGLFCYNKTTDSLQQFMPHSEERGSLTTSLTSDLCMDRQNNLWIGTYDGGVNILPAAPQSIHILRRGSEERSSIGHGEVSGLYEDRDGCLWVTSMGGGIARVQPDFKTTKNYKFDKDHALQYPWTHVVEGDHHGNFWFGGALSAFYEWQTRTSKNIKAPDSKRIGHLNGTITVISEDSSGNMWFGSAFSGLKCLTASGEFLEYCHDPDDAASLPKGKLLDLCKGASRRKFHFAQGLALYAQTRAAAHGQFFFHRF